MADDIFKDIVDALQSGQQLPRIDITNTQGVVIVQKGGSEIKTTSISGIRTINEGLNVKGEEKR